MILGAESGVRSPGSGVADRVSPSPSRPGERVPAGNPESGGAIFFYLGESRIESPGGKKKTGTVGSCQTINYKRKKSYVGESMGES